MNAPPLWAAARLSVCCWCLASVSMLRAMNVASEPSASAIGFSG